MATAVSKTSTTSSGKRKRSPTPAFYAVKVGKVPGIYQTWQEAHQQTLGFDRAVCEKFGTYTEAEAFMNGSRNHTTKPGKPKYYGVAVGHVPGVYTDWASVQAQIKSCKGANQKGFATREEAQAYVDTFARRSGGPISLRGDLSETSSLAAAKMDKTEGSAPKRQKKENAPPTPNLSNGDIKIEPGLGPLPLDAVDGFDPNIKLDLDSGAIRMKTDEELSARKSQPNGDFSGPIVVHTDGSSLGNGQVGSRGGVGVYFGPNDARNVSEPLKGAKQTNQRAELVAIARALDHVPIDREVVIITDSNYSIKCLREWIRNWERRNWKNSAGKDVENQEFIKPIISRMRERLLCKADTKFQWVKGHNGDAGNVAADELANRGARENNPQSRAGHHSDLSKTLRTRYMSYKEFEEKLKAKNTEADEFDQDLSDEDFAGIDAGMSETEPKVQSTSLAQDIVRPVVDAEQQVEADVQASQAALDLMVENDLPLPSIGATQTTVMQEKVDGFESTLKIEERIHQK